MSQMLFLRVHKEGKLIAVKQFQSTQIVIGNQATADLQIDDPNVSPVHAMIEDRGGSYYVCDLGSQQGTFKNGTAILDESIQSGDHLKIGEYELEFFIGIPKPAAKPAGAPENTVIAPPPVTKPVAKPIVSENTVVAAIPKDAKPEIVKPVVPVVAPEAKTPVKKEPVVPATFSAPAPTPTPVVPSAPSISQGAGELLGEYQTRKSPLTFAPKSTYKNVDEIIQPSKGSLVEILVVWGDRVLTTYHCSKMGEVRVGAHPKNDIILPVLSTDTSSQILLKVTNETLVYIHPSVRGQLYQQGNKKLGFEELSTQGRIQNHGSVQALKLEQGEMVRIDYGDGISIFVRFVSPTPKPLLAPTLGLSSTELTGLVISLILGGLLYLFVSIQQDIVPEEKPEDEIKVTKFIFTQKFEVPPTPPPMKEEEPTPPPRRSTPPPKKVEVKDTTENRAQMRPTKAQQKAAGGAAEARPNDSKSEKKILTSDKVNPKNNPKVDSGGVKSNKDVNAGTTERRDIKNTGLLGAFAKGGAQTQLAKANQGVGAIAGLSQSATGEAGSGGGGEKSEGLREIGKGGQGTATVGIAGVETKGRGGGKSGYGEGSVGTKQSATIDINESELDSDGSIDKEAILRVIKANIGQIRSCYDRELNKNPGLFGNVTLHFELGVGGKVTSISVKSSSMKNSAVESCMTSRARAWRFPDPPPGLIPTFDYNYVFAAK